MDRASPDEPHGAPKPDTAGVVAHVLAEKFGDHALEVATRQLDAATSDTRDSWHAVVSHLTR